MINIIYNGVLFGLLLSFLVGPVFFVLIETSLNKGIKHAIFLDLGVLLSDILYLIASFYVAKEINEWLNENSFIKYIAGGIFVIIGVFSILKKRPHNKEGAIYNTEDKQIPYLKKRTFVGLIAKGIGLNAINPGVLIYWIAACTYATEKLQVSNNLLIYYFGATLGTMFCMDLFKIYFARKLKRKMNSNNL